MALDLTQLEVVLARATELDGDPERPQVFEESDVLRVGAELGISATSVRQAMAEARSGQSRTVSATGSIPGTPIEVRGDLAGYFTSRGLAVDERGVWKQRNGWWPDLYRYRALVPVLLSVAQAGRATRVVLTAGLSHIWRIHLLAGFLGVLSVIGLLNAGVTGLIGGFVQSATVVGLSWWTYLRRREAIASRLRTALEEVSLPSYRAQRQLLPPASF